VNGTRSDKRTFQLLAYPKLCKKWLLVCSLSCFQVGFFGERGNDYVADFFRVFGSEALQPFDNFYLYAVLKRMEAKLKLNQ